MQKDFDNQKVENKAMEHWEYIEKLLRIHDENNNVINKIGYHYRTAFIHGYKHGFEDAKREVR